MPSNTPKFAARVNHSFSLILFDASLGMGANMKDFLRRPASALSQQSSAAILTSEKLLFP